MISVQRNHTLWLLKHERDDDRFLQIFGDFASLIRRSEKACEKAAEQGDQDYAQFIGESEAEYLEEIIGASFLLLQAKIRRVCSATERLQLLQLSGCARCAGGAPRLLLTERRPARCPTTRAANATDGGSVSLKPPSISRAVAAQILPGSLAWF